MQLNSKLLYVIIFVLLISSIETLGQGMIKYGNEHTSIKIALIGTLSYITISFILYYLYNHEKMAIINAWWNIMTSITVTLSGVFLFKESLEHTELIGIILVIIGAGFLSANELGLTHRQ